MCIIVLSKAFSAILERYDINYYFAISLWVVSLLIVRRISYDRNIIFFGAYKRTSYDFTDHLHKSLPIFQSISLIFIRSLPYILRGNKEDPARKKFGCIDFFGQLAMFAFDTFFCSKVWLRLFSILIEVFGTSSIVTNSVIISIINRLPTSFFCSTE